MLFVAAPAHAQTGPSVVGIPSVTQPTVGVTFNTGDVIRVTFLFSESVVVDTTGGTPRVGLTIGGQVRFADYDEIINNNTLIFRYTVRTADRDDDGIVVAADALSANGGTIRNADGDDADLTHGVAIFAFRVANDPPVGVNINAPGDGASIDSGQAVTLSGGATDFDSDAADLTFTWSASAGTLTDADGFTGGWTAPTLAVGASALAVSLTLRVSDGVGANEDTVTVMVQPSTNALPTATITTPATPAVSVASGETLNLVGEGADAEDDDADLTLAWSVTGGGALTETTGATTAWRAPAVAVSASALTAIITLTATDSDGASGDATLTVTVNPRANAAPTANDDTMRVGVGESVAVDVLANDRDGDGDALTVTAVTDGAAGTVTIAADGSDLTYTHDGGDADADAFTYTVSDGNATATATVSVTIGDDTAAVDAMLNDEVLPTVVREVGVGAVNAIAGRVGRVFDGGASSSFTVANYNFADGAGDHRTFWADADYLNFDGDDDGVDYDGDLTTITVGADATVGKNKLAGVAVSVSESEVDYQTELGDGEQKLSLTSLHPYFAWRDADANFWASVGYGEGELELSHDDDEVKRDADLRTLGVGGAKKFWRDGERDAKVHARLVHSELEVDADGDLAAFELDAWRATLGLEFARERRLADGTLTTTSGVAVRQDGGDGDGGGGAEVGGELKYNGDGVTLNLRGHFLFGRADYDEWNISGGVTVTPKHGTGLSFNFTPTVDHANDMQLQTELGYGMSYRSSLLTPFTHITTDDTTIGARLLSTNGWHTHLTATRTDAADTVVLKLNLDL